jgi:hypothetical protein
MDVKIPKLIHKYGGSFPHNPSKSPKMMFIMVVFIMGFLDEGGYSICGHKNILTPTLLDPWPWIHLGM